MRRHGVLNAALPGRIARPHVELTAMVGRAQLVIRTGEATA